MMTFPSLYSAQEITDIEQALSDVCALDDLMACAGRHVFESAEKYYPEAQQWAVICGPGNNAGDAYIAATLARVANKQVTVYATVLPEALTGAACEAAKTYTAVADVVLIGDAWELPKNVDLIIDGVFGVGLNKSVTGLYAQCIAEMNAHDAPVIAIDVPSGLDATTGYPRGLAVQADQTLVMLAHKQGLYMGQAQAYVGDVHFHDLNISRTLLSKHHRMLLTQAGLRSLLPRRPVDIHKHACGHVLIIGGDQGMHGAAVLAGRAALRAGAGLVSLAVHPQSVTHGVGSTPELMCHGIAEVDTLGPLLEQADAVVVGPGMCSSDWAQEIVGRVLDRDIPMVVDAGALPFLKGRRAHFADIVCTPHVGEAARLLGVPAAAIQQDRFAAVDALVNQFGGAMVLKGAGTLIRHQADTMLCPFGTPGLATAGTGDVLAGVIGALLAQGCAPFDAATLGVGLHALAGEAAAQEKTVYGMLASDVIEALPTAFAKLL